ncbi:MAG: Rrf2 family transcriptional regulator [Firmicutes bacterium]|nr:Rrf2 family transcriptional regulator [Clostridia bacterium]MCR4719039.1 Rrf2 family transcriptional regulator [Bacillota bacterium]
MQISSRFTIAIHVLTCIETFKDDYKTTSDFLAVSVNVNPVVIRRILQQLKKAGIVETKRGSGGAYAAKPLDEITFYDVYKAVDCVEGDLFHFHENPNTKCPVGRNIHFVLDDRLRDVQNAMENKLKEIKLSDVVADTVKLIEKEAK